MLSFPLLGRSCSLAAPAPWPLLLLGRSCSLAALSLLSYLLLASSQTAQAQGGYQGGYPGGGAGYTVHCTGGTINGKALTPTDSPYPGSTGSTAGTAGQSAQPSNGQPGSINITASDGGAITGTLTWSGGSANTPAPPAAIIMETSGASWSGTIGDSPNVVFATDSGLGAGVTAVSSNTASSVGYSGTKYSLATSGASSTTTCSPNFVLSGTTGVNTDSYESCTLSYTYTAAGFPVTVKLAGTTPDSSGNLNILVGQHCTASLVGIPSGCTVSNYQWSVTGTTFQTWSADTPSFPVMVGGVQIGIIPENPDATYEVDGPGPLTNSTAGWYWNDLAKGTGNNTRETVSCTVTVTPPTGQGAALTVTATTPITVWTPVWTATGNGASVVVDNTFQAPDFWLHAGPGPLDFGATRGMTWDATLSPPSAPVPFGIGSLAIVQIITGCDQGMTSNTTPPLSIPGPGNGQTGLDTSWPYGWAISTTIVGGIKYESGDSPGVRVTNLRSAHDNISFEDYLMYCPPSSVQYVPLAKYIWSANMGASLPATGNWINFTGTAGTVTDAQKTGQFLPNNKFPSWTDIVTAQ